MALNQIGDQALRYFYREVAKFHLRPIRKLYFQFDPFHYNAKTVRDILFHLSSRKIRKTSDTCVIKAAVVCDRSEPVISVDLHNGMSILFKCADLEPIDVAREFNKIIEQYDVKEEEPTFKLKSESKQRR